MGRQRSYTSLSVFLNTRLIGQLTREGSGAISFIYDPDWLAWKHRMPVSLSLPLREDRYVGAPVVAVFENLLPDNDAIRRRVAERVGAEGIDAYSLLAEIGRDCVGALQFLPDGAGPSAGDAITGRPISNSEVEALLNDLATRPLGIDRERDFRISVAGAQEKTALLYHQGQWFEPFGTTPTTHIIKPQIGKLPNGMDLSDSVENEFFCLKLLAGFGLRTANAEIVLFGERKALAVERFDRTWTKDGRLIRLPQEDMCQAHSIPPSRKYENEGGPGIVEIMELLRGSDEPLADRESFFKANILFWLIGATDGHAKNFSIAIRPGGSFSLTPLYDVMTVQPSVDSGLLQRKSFKMAMRFGKSGHYRVADITRRHIEETGLQSGMSRQVISSIIEDITALADRAFASATSAVPKAFPSGLIESVRQGFDKRLRSLD
jgi:serine/threonine-protein kinase HipA